jgi:hypothetical protein
VEVLGRLSERYGLVGVVSGRPVSYLVDRLAAAGVDTVRVAVRTEEAPPELLRRADLVVDGPEGCLAVFEELARD